MSQDKVCLLGPSLPVDCTVSRIGKISSPADDAQEFTAVFQEKSMFQIQKLNDRIDTD